MYRIYKHSKVISRVLLVIITLTFILPLSGCGESMKSFSGEVQQTIKRRGEDNIALNKKLQDAGLIRESEAESINTNIDSNTNELIDKVKSGEKSALALMYKALVGWRRPCYACYKEELEEENRNTDGEKVKILKFEPWSEQFLTQESASNEMFSKGALFTGGKVQPIPFISENITDTINERMAYPIYVLKTPEELGLPLENGDLPLDGLVEAVSQVVADPKTMTREKLANYFRAVRIQDKTTTQETYLTLYDLGKRENRVAGPSMGSSRVTDDSSYFDWNDANSKKAAKDATNKVIKPADCASKESHTCGKSGEADFMDSISDQSPGNDLTLSQSGEEVVQLRFNEFNAKAIQNIIDTIGLNQDQFLVFDGGLYLLNYPVSYISEIKESADKNNYQTYFEKSKLSINLKTGKLFKDGIEVNMTDPYYSIKGGAQGKEQQASFGVYGTTNMILGEKNQSVTVGQIVLKDYLEATYAPGILDNEPLVVFGRKIRFLNLKGDKDTIVARYYNKEGLQIPDTADLYIDAFADIPAALNTGGQEIHYIGVKGEKVDQTDTEEDDEESSDTSSGFDAKSAIKRIDSLPKKTVSSIKPCTAFPGDQIGNVDKGANDKPLFYAILIKDNPFRTALFSGWINKQDASSNSFTWWNQWLIDHNYKYKLDTTALDNYFKGNYSFEMTDYGYIILDLDTVAKIQQGYAIEDKQTQSSWIRTTFIVFGVLCITYAFVICACWALDTNVDLGFNVLDKMSFGHWSAVKDAEELPMINNEEKQYKDFRGITKSALIIAVIGVILITVNINDIIAILVTIFGGISKVFSQIVFGQ